MNLNQLRAFCTLSRTLHYSRASEELQIAQPSLSRMIAQLEKELGTPLFEKQGRNIILTKQGEIFLDHVSRGVGEIDQGVSVLKEFIDPGQGTIDFAFIYALSPSFATHLVKKFLDAPENKNIHFHFYQGNSRDIIRKIKEGRRDVGFCSYVEDEPLVECVRSRGRNMYLWSPGIIRLRESIP